MSVVYAPSEFDLTIMQALKEISHEAIASTPRFVPQDEGWSTSAMVRERRNLRSLDTRKALNHLYVEGLVDKQRFENVEFFRLTAKGHIALYEKGSAPTPIEVDATKWTGVVSPVQSLQALQIISQIEDVAEVMRDNAERAQVMGLVVALKTLLELPNPPRMGLLALLRDPAFSNIIQIGTFLAAMIAALRA